MTNSEQQKNCDKSCEHSNQTKLQLKADQNLKTAEAKKEEEKLDPTHFGDWQVNCRTIDF